MELSSPKIVLISSGQPSLNPRLVKEADALADAGYRVTVLYAYWNAWGTAHDMDLLRTKKWDYIRVGGDPEETPAIYWLSRVIQKVAAQIFRATHIRCFADVAMARAGYFLRRKAQQYKAAIYIAHNLGALPAAAIAAKRNRALYGFDAEDFHRQEVNDDENSYHYRLCSAIEDKYIPAAAYITAASPLIAGEYARTYRRPVTAILNVFPRVKHAAVHPGAGPLRLIWFSQTTGPNRGIETAIEALALSGVATELHLLGRPAAGYEAALLNHARRLGFDTDRIIFHEPVTSDKIFGFVSRFDIGLASEPGFCLNNNIALSNKIFTYLQCGLAVLASDTPAQSAFLAQYPQIGKLYHDAQDLSAIIRLYNTDRALLAAARKEAFRAGQTDLNWETESHKLLTIVNSLLTERGKPQLNQVSN